MPAALRPAAARVAMVFQDSHSALNPLVSIGAQLQEPLQRRQKLSKLAAKQAAIELLKAMGLPEPVSLLQRCHVEISGGQRQRVCIALALACETSLLVADEPTTALDVVTQAQVLRVLKASTEFDWDGEPRRRFPIRYREKRQAVPRFRAKRDQTDRRS